MAALRLAIQEFSSCSTLLSKLSDVATYQNMQCIDLFYLRWCNYFPNRLQAKIVLCTRDSAMSANVNII